MGDASLRGGCSDDLPESGVSEQGYRGKGTRGIGVTGQRDRGVMGVRREW